MVEFGRVVDELKAAGIGGSENGGGRTCGWPWRVVVWDRLTHIAIYDVPSDG